MSTQIPEQRCWKCGYKMDQTTSAIGEHQPHPGDVSLCLACGAIQVFNADLTLRHPTAEEEAKFASDPRIMEVQIVRAGLIGDKLKPKKPRP